MSVETLNPFPVETIDPHAHEAARIQELAQEAHAYSQDVMLKQMATERNSHLNPGDIWKPSTLHHATKVGPLRLILHQGHLSTQLETADGTLGPDRTTDPAINFGGIINKDLPADSSLYDRVGNIYYSTHKSSEVYLHYLRPDGSYREGDEHGDDIITYMDGGLPSTEISAITMHNMGTSIAKLDKVRDTVAEAGFFIPIFDSEGKLAYSREDFDRDMEAMKDGSYVRHSQKHEDYEAAQTQQLRTIERERRAQEQRDTIADIHTAAETGISIKEARDRRIADQFNVPYEVYIDPNWSPL